uniref:Uncharacterized protein n=1 Tax=Arundo donax TaxID=35708 RepID=A0A0A9DQI6_ARUDO
MLSSHQAGSLPSILLNQRHRFHCWVVFPCIFLNSSRSIMKENTNRRLIGNITSSVRSNYW